MANTDVENKEEEVVSGEHDSHELEETVIDITEDENQRIYRQEDIENISVNTLKEDGISHISVDDAKLIIDVVWDTIYNGLRNGYIIKLHGKGQFYLSRRSARVGRNPNTGEEHHIPEREIMAFRVSPAVAKRLRAERQRLKETGELS